MLRFTRTLAALSFITALTGATAVTAQAKPDCPQAFVGYSSRSPILDLLLDPQASAELNRSGALEGLPKGFLSTSAPTFAAIISPGYLLENSAFRRPDAAARIAELDRALAKIPVTQEAARKRCARYDSVSPFIATPKRRPAILVFEKINGFRDDPSVAAAHRALAEMAARRGWGVVFTGNGGAFNRRQLKVFDAVVWNNVSGDVLTTPQRQALKAYLQSGGGFAGFHGSGGDPVYWWDWYADDLLRARFIGHPGSPQFQSARVIVEQPGRGVAEGLPSSWTMTEEWYSFAASPRSKGVHVIARLDEATYTPGAELMMGDHPIAWTSCLGNGRSFYSAIGHRPENYAEPNSLRLLENGIAWAAGQGPTRCRAGKEVAIAR
jgi:type 1 glutamine amidotransferase